MKVALVMFKDGQRRDFPLTEMTTTIGRAGDCALRIPARDVSRHHCEVTLGVDGVLVRDVGSSNGTYVNGKRVAQVELQAGHPLRIGPALFVVQIDGKPAKLNPADYASPVAAGDTPTAAEDVETEEVLDMDDLDFDVDDLFRSDDEDDDESRK